MAWVPFAAMAAGGLMDKLWGGNKKPQLQKIPTMTPQQQQMLSQLLTGLMGGGTGGGPLGNQMGMLQNLMNPSSEAMNQFTQPYMDQFNQQTVPGLAERFAGAGAMGGGLSSSGFGQSLSAAGGNLQHMLAQLKGQLGLQAGSQLQGLMGMGMNAQPFAYLHQPQGTGIFPSMMQGWAQSGFPGPWNG